MKKIALLTMIGALCLTGCSIVKEEDKTAPALELTKTRVQVGVNSQVDINLIFKKQLMKLMEI